MRMHMHMNIHTSCTHLHAHTCMQTHIMRFACTCMHACMYTDICAPTWHTHAHSQLSRYHNYHSCNDQLLLGFLCSPGGPHRRWRLHRCRDLLGRLEEGGRHISCSTRYVINLGLACDPMWYPVWHDACRMVGHSML